LSRGDNTWPKLGRLETSLQVNLADNFCVELNAPVEPTQDLPAQRRKVSPTMFYLIAIFLVMVSPLVVPVTVQILHTINGWKQRAADARPALAGAVRPAFGPALRGAVPAAA
jgi:hypothetical protein